MDETNVGMSEDLASVLDNEKMMEGQNSEKLTDFFKKLIQTDAQIRKLKQTINNNYQIENLKSITDRFKRSIRNRGQYRIKSKLAKNHKASFNTNNGNLNNIKDKRSITKTDSGLTGYVFEAEKLLIQYEPDKKRNFPKCSHVQETKSHEKHLKHPFYKHSQRVDEMLETYKKPQDTTENDKIDDIFVIENLKMKKVGSVPKAKSKDQERSLANTHYRKINENDNDDLSSIAVDITESVDVSNDLDYNMEKFLSTTPIYDVALSVSTFINPIDQTIGKSKLLRNEHGVKRKLLQIDEEEDQEEVGYEDLKEVLTDDQEGHDDLEQNKERIKRNDAEQFGVPEHFYENKHNPLNVNNPNWKGPLPLYPDELNAMIKQAALQNLVIPIPVNTKDTKIERDKDEKDISDTQYVEDYSDNKYNKMVRMAQAYSDYGVLYNKKGKGNENDKGFKSENTSKFYKIFNKHRLFGRPKKGSSSDGFRLEIKPGNIPDEHQELIQAIQKHVKITKHPVHEAHSTTLHPINPEYEKLFTSVDQMHLETNSDISKTANTGKSIIFTIRKGSRSLKSIDMPHDENNDTLTLSVSESNITNTNSMNDTTDGIVSFISMMSDWFKALAGLSGEIKNEENNNTVSNFTISKSKNKYLVENNTKDILYPYYDSDMVDNIGHRSRVLMSIDDSFDVDKSGVKKSETDDILPVALVLASNDTREKENKPIKNKTLVKRSLGDNLVFWNDLYDDDEYGVKLDYMDNLRDKHSVKSVKTAIHKSKDWIQGKFKNVTRKLKAKFKTKKKTGGTMKKTTKIVKPAKPCNNTVDPCLGIKRHVRNTNNNEITNTKESFAALTANMKKVCQEAAKAVQNTRNIEVRENSKEGAAATSLMQQLVRMMADLVDFQVQQKTCAKLPADLYNFLEWLTAPADNDPQIDNLTPGATDYAAVDDDLTRFEKSTEFNFDLSSSLTEDTHQDDRTECLGTINAVQELIQQYEGMSDEDKSKMTGVREYLENQLQYLNNKLSGLDASNLYKLYEKRQVPRIRREADTVNQKQIQKENKKKKEKIDNMTTKTHKKDNTKNMFNAKENNVKKKAKRNLRDVYYKAVEEAKKTTAKDLKQALDKVYH